MKKIRSVLAAAAAFSLAACASTPSASAAAKVVTGTADGFGGTITAEVTVDESGKITDLVLTGEDVRRILAVRRCPNCKKRLSRPGRWKASMEFPGQLTRARVCSLRSAMRLELQHQRRRYLRRQ